MLAFIILFSVIFTPVVYAQTEQRITADNFISLKTANKNGEIRYFSGKDYNRVEYYENDSLLNVAILDKKSKDIYYYDELAIKDISGKSHTNNDLLSVKHTEKYNANEFIQNNIKLVQDDKSGIIYTYIKFRAFDFGDGETYMRYLYGGKGTEEMRKSSWHFGASTALTVIVAVISSVLSGGLLQIAIAAIGVVGGITLSACTIKRWHKYYFWKYRLVQTTPTSFIGYTGNLIYKKMEKVEVNSSSSYWEIYYTSIWPYSSSLRDDIMERPGLI